MLRGSIPHQGVLQDADTAVYLLLDIKQHTSSKQLHPNVSAIPSPHPLALPLLATRSRKPHAIPAQEHNTNTTTTQAQPHALILCVRDAVDKHARLALDGERRGGGGRERKRERQCEGSPEEHRGGV